MTKKEGKSYYDAVLNFKYPENMLTAIYVPKKLVKYLEEYGILRQYITNLVRLNDLVSDYKKVTRGLLITDNPSVMLMNSFVFNISEEGYGFWMSVYFKIIQDEQKKEKNAK